MTAVGDGVKVVPWLPEDDARVEAFVAAHPEGLVYYAPSFRTFLLRVAGGECRSRLAYEDGRLTGVLPMLECDGPYGRVLNSLPFFGSNGGVLASTPAADAALRREFEAAAEAVASATWIPHPFVAVTPPSHDLSDERIAQWTALGATDEPDLLARVESSARRNLQHARLAGVRVREDLDAVAFLETVHRENMGVIGGRAKPHEFFVHLQDAMRPGRDWRLFVADCQGEPVAALLTFEAARTVEYVMPVVRESARAAQPTAAILLHAMIDAARRGFTRWNWGATWLTQDGVYRFKKKWGARERRFHYAVVLNDESLLRRDATELLAAYGWYYTVPFGALETAS